MLSNTRCRNQEEQHEVQDVKVNPDPSKDSPACLKCVLNDVNQSVEAWHDVDNVDDEGNSGVICFIINQNG